jgi:hypothetical protein
MGNVGVDVRCGVSAPPLEGGQPRKPATEKGDSPCLVRNSGAAEEKNCSTIWRSAGGGFPETRSLRVPSGTGVCPPAWLLSPHRPCSRLGWCGVAQRHKGLRYPDESHWSEQPDWINNPANWITSGTWASGRCGLSCKAEASPRPAGCSPHCTTPPATSISCPLSERKTHKTRVPAATSGTQVR